MADIKKPNNHSVGQMSLVWNNHFAPEMASRFDKAQEYIDTSCLRYCDEYIPFLTGKMKESGTFGTVIGSGRIVYTAPYAKWQNYHNAGRGKQGTAHGGLRGRLPFERMKTDKGDSSNTKTNMLAVEELRFSAFYDYELDGKTPAFTYCESYSDNMSILTLDINDTEDV